MIVLGYSGLDNSVAFARRDPALRPGEERMVQGLDSAAVLLADGRVVAAAAEERFSFEKHTNAFPEGAVRYCLAEAGIGLDAVDRVAHGFDYGRTAGLHATSSHYAAVLDPALQPALWRGRFNVTLPDGAFRPVPHHLAHAASAYFPSGFEDALCVVCDGMGEFESMTVYAAQGGLFRLLTNFGIRESLGILYGLVTVHLGFAFNADEYKVMGLAPYGDPSRFRPFFDSIVDLQADGRYVIRLNRLVGDISPPYRALLRYLEEAVIARPETTETLPQAHCDFAAAAQECLERVLFHVLGHWRQTTGLTRLCMAGGVALNCTFNGKLIQSGLFDEVYIQPAAGDDGTALGAALIAARDSGESLPPGRPDELPFFGPGWGEDAIRTAIANAGDGLHPVALASEQAAAVDAAQAINKDEIVAWFQGRMEFGPRALGNRSILANPLDRDIKRRLNAVIKLREGFRPFAPAVAAEHAGDYFDFIPSPAYDVMLATCPVRPDWRDRLPGITHVDGSARMQRVDRAHNPLFHRLITEFGALSGIHCVVNTSFNLRGQAIVAAPDNAIATFRKVAIDRLYLGRFRLSKAPR